LDKHSSFTDLTQRSADQLLDLPFKPRPARAATGLRTLEFAGDQLAVPGQDRDRPRHGCDLGENLAAQTMTDLTERGSLGVRELEPPLQLGLRMRFSAARYSFRASRP
jgi:hypothetical protein